MCGVQATTSKQRRQESACSILLALSLAASSAASVGPPRLQLRPCVFCNDGSVNRQPSRTVGTFFYRDKKRARAKKGSPRIIPSRGCVRFIIAPLRTAFPPPFRRVSHIARARRRRIVVMTTTTGRTALILPITSPADPQPGRVATVVRLSVQLVVFTPGRRSPRRRGAVITVTVAVAVSAFSLLLPLSFALPLILAIPVSAILTPIPRRRPRRRVPRAITPIIGRFAPRRSRPDGLRTARRVVLARSTPPTAAIVESFRNGSRVRYAILVLVAVRAGVPPRCVCTRGSDRSMRRRGRGRGVTRPGRGVVTARTSRRRWCTRGGPTSTAAATAGRARRWRARRSRTGRRRTRRNRRSDVVGRRWWLHNMSISRGT